MLSTVPQAIELLRESIRQIGPILPVYKYRDTVLDGRKRAACCVEVGRDIPTVIIKDETTAARVLWEHHPERAIEMFTPKTAPAACALFGCRLVDVVPYFKKKPPKYPERRRTGERARVVSLTLDPVQLNTRIARTLHEQTKQTAEGINVPTAEFVRGALVLAIREPDQVRAILLASHVAAE